jgi:predicted Rossmann-fold nucleotide-binding protein
LLALAAELGEAIADRGWTLVWGGGNVSAMGALATAARASSPRCWCAAKSPITTPTS